ncbi:hypothetical protein CRM22_002081 [Opisthorchis felineus]|uniref:Ig-like domain-containing protein n=1 Tax=Opisthorchis felineus TaxID=147828 RepID=A0A4S2MC30_OPIFE|nr:hypothetical protein CRM22_002081 [Opisthorchis felineus]
MLAALRIALIVNLLLPQTGSTCTPQVDVSVFRCSHIRLTDVPSIIHRNTLDLDLSHNLIEVLHEDSFSRLVSLRRLSLNHNHIYKITERAFLPLGQTLEFLDLRNNHLISNRLTPFPVTALACLIKLKQLDLSRNPIGFIPSGFLRNMGATLERLDLAASTLKIHIEPGAFSGLAKLHHLNLAHNAFTDLGKQSFDGLRPEYFVRLSLENVQWDCDCQMLWFRRWLGLVPRKAMFTDSHPGGECATPPLFKGQSLLQLNLTDLQCAPQLVGTVPPSAELDPSSPIQVVGFSGFNLTLACTFISEPKMQVEWYQNSVLIQPHWKRLKQVTDTGTKFTTSLHFTSLDNELDTGLYRCQTANQKGIAAANFVLNVENGLAKANAAGNKNIPQTKETSDLSGPTEFGKYILIIGAIMAANITFIIAGVITYCCIRTRTPVRSKHPGRSGTTQSCYDNMINRTHVQRNEVFSSPISAVQNPCAQGLYEINHPGPIGTDSEINMHPDYSSLGQIVNLHNTSTLCPPTPQNHRIGISSPLLQSPFTVRISSPSRFSSDFASVSLQQCELSPLVYEQANVNEFLHPEISQTQVKSPYYKLTVHREKEHLPGELIYVPSSTSHHKMPPSPSQTTVNPLCLKELDEMASTRSDSPSSGSDMLTDDLELLCPVHGILAEQSPDTARRKKSKRSSPVCVVHSRPNQTDPECPLHGNSQNPKPNGNKHLYNTLPMNLHKPSCPVYYTNLGQARNSSSILNMSLSPRDTSRNASFQHSCRGNTLPR